MKKFEMLCEMDNGHLTPISPILEDSLTLIFPRQANHEGLSSFNVQLYAHTAHSFAPPSLTPPYYKSNLPK